MNQTQALKILKSGANVFLTGEPGSGKTFVINEYVEYLQSHGIKPAVTASTGIAATHIGGMTIHSWSGIGIKNSLNQGELRFIATNDYVKKRVGLANVLIIDEISMLPPCALEMINSICQEVKDSSQPFGGMQVVLVGDFFQLPPVTKRVVNEFSQENIFNEDGKVPRFAYDSPIWQEVEFLTCYITEQYRQDDTDLVSVLSKIRTNNFDGIALSHIQKRKIDPLNLPEFAPKLYSHNIDVDRVNDLMLAKIPGESKLFMMVSMGHDALVNVMKKGCLSPENLYLKIGASVMFTKNNPKDGFVNGTLGVVVGFDSETGLPTIEIRNGRKIEVGLAEWTVEEDGKIKGRLSQLPLRLAWAITVHKSQGISLDEAVIDLSRVFEYGQGYVAISRVKRLSGVYILGWNEMAFQVDPEVLKKDIEFRDFSIDAENFYCQISDKEYEKLQKDFIIKCDGEINISDVANKDKKSKISTYDETKKYWDKRVKIAQIAQIRNLSEKTIWNHIEKLIEEGKITRVELMREVPASKSKDIYKIQTIFKDLSTTKLTPVFDHFKGKYSYEEIKLAKMLME